MDAPLKPPAGKQEPPQSGGGAVDPELKPWRDLPTTFNDTDICCVSGEYPSEGPKDFAVPSRDGGGWVVGFRFKARAIYKNSGTLEGRNCKCSCCHFYQRVVRNDVTVENADVPELPAPPYDDCSWTVYDVKSGKIVGTIPPSKGGPDEQPTPPEGTAVRWECYGANPTQFKSEKEFDASGEAQGLVQETVGGDCVYIMKDYPQVRGVPSGSLVTRDWMSLGLVWDSCVGLTRVLGELPHKQKIRAVAGWKNEAKDPAAPAGK